MAHAAGAGGEDDFSASEALRTIGETGTRDEALKARTEGLTWVLWGMANAGVGLTYAATLSPDGAVPPRVVPAAALWVAAALAATVGLWRSAALTFRTGMTTRRTVAFLAGWVALTTLLVLLILVPTGLGVPTLADAGGAAGQAKLLALGLLLVGFGVVNPLGFTTTGRRTAAALGVVAVAAGTYGLAAGLTGSAGLAYLTAVLGGSWVAGGLVALYRG